MRYVTNTKGISISLQVRYCIAICNLVNARRTAALLWYIVKATITVALANPSILLSSGVFGQVRDEGDEPFHWNVGHRDVCTRCHDSYRDRIYSPQEETQLRYTLHTSLSLLLY